MERWYYTYAGLRISSELPIPEWAIFEEREPFDDPDVILSLIPAMTPPALDLPIITATEYHFHVPEAGYYCVRKGREIIIAPAPDSGCRELRLFLLGSAWGALMYQRGILALHVSAIETGGGVLLFCGPTGSGKSTIAAWLTGRGFRFAGDDLCCFGNTAGGHPVIYPAAPRLKLWREALRHLGKSEEGLERDYFRQEKYHMTLTMEEKRPPMPVTGIYLLAWGEPRLTRLTGLEALRRVVASATYRGYLLEPMGQIAVHWERCAALITCAPVLEFRRPNDWSAMEEAMNMFLTQFRV